MAPDITIKILYVEWRDGRPFFNPSPRLRKLGFKSHNLRHDDEEWYTLEECQSFITDIKKQIEAREEAKDAGKRLKPVALPKTAYTIGHMWADCLKRPEFQGRQVVDGKKTRKPLSPQTVSFYQVNMDRLMRFAPEIWAAHPKALSAAKLEDVLERMEVAHGLAIARAVKSSLSAVYGKMKTKLGIKTNPCADVSLPTPEARLRYAEVEEIRQLIRAADLIGRPEVGDSILLGCMTGQRQGDRLNLVGGQVIPDNQFGEAYIFRQNKTGAVVIVPATPDLKVRMDASRTRRSGLMREAEQAAKLKRQPAPVAHLNLVIDERLQTPFKASRDYSHYGKIFRQVRAAAVDGIQNDDGSWTLKPMASLADFTDQDLRDTAVTWLGLAGVDVPGICAITGHSEISAYTVLKHYLGRHPEMARQAIGKLVVWLEGKGVRL